MNNRRTGKVARLNFDLRTRVNQMLRDGRTYAEIAAAVKQEDPAADLNAENISAWKDGGHRDWLREQSRLDDLRVQQEFAADLVRAGEGSLIHEASLQLAASQIYDVLSDFPLRELKGFMAENPENYPKLVRALSKLSEGGLKYERYRDEVAERRRKIEAELGKARDKGGLAPETLEAIERELRLL